MEKMFSSMMQGFFSGVSEEDKQKMKTCCENMAAMCDVSPKKWTHS